MAASYFPRSDSGLVVWLQNFSKCTAFAGQSAWGLRLPKSKMRSTSPSRWRRRFRWTSKKYAEWQAAVAKTAELRTQALAEIQRIIDRMKTSTGYSDEIGKTLMAVPSRTESRNLDDIKPALRGPGPRWQSADSLDARRARRNQRVQPKAWRAVDAAGHRHQASL